MMVILDKNRTGNGFVQRWVCKASIFLNHIDFHFQQIDFTKSSIWFRKWIWIATRLKCSPMSRVCRNFWSLFSPSEKSIHYENRYSHLYVSWLIRTVLVVDGCCFCSISIKNHKFGSIFYIMNELMLLLPLSLSNQIIWNPPNNRGHSHVAMHTYFQSG